MEPVSILSRNISQTKQFVWVSSGFMLNIFVQKTFNIDCVVIFEVKLPVSMPV